ncbi:MAG: iron-sulfur cluster assembly accessory protein [Euryarchaeota archaeon]|nr:iron-sulfur cluster assembly accessory protein [Euryarchaeota archaeon]
MATDTQRPVPELRQTSARLNDKQGWPSPRGATAANDRAPIAITSRASSEFLSLSRQQKKQGWGLRVSMVGVGCSGYAYSIEFQKRPSRGDRVISTRGLRVFLESKSLRYLEGAVIDYEERERGFRVFNPNAERPSGNGGRLQLED